MCETEGGSIREQKERAEAVGLLRAAVSEVHTGASNL